MGDNVDDNNNSIGERFYLKKLNKLGNCYQHELFVYSAIHMCHRGLNFLGGDQFGEQVV